MLGQSRAIQDVLEEARFLSATSVNLLLAGEAGVGKELLAQFIHSNSPRRQRKMQSLNCEGVPQPRLELDLFGRADRVGLFEMAHASTLLLEEVGEIEVRTQSLLLRALETGGKRDVRIVSTTSRGLLKRSSGHAFSDDLYYRLNVARLQVPPLRSRPEDVSCLMRHHLKTLSEQLRLPLCELHPSAMAKLEAHSWPGNLRELRRVAALLAVRHAGRVTAADDLAEVLAQRAPASPIGRRDLGPVSPIRLTRLRRRHAAS